MDKQKLRLLSTSAVGKLFSNALLKKKSIYMKVGDCA